MDGARDGGFQTKFQKIKSRNAKSKDFLPFKIMRCDTKATEDGGEQQKCFPSMSKLGNHFMYTFQSFFRPRVLLCELEVSYSMCIGRY